MTGLWLYHYYEADTGPFMNLSDLPMEEAAAVQARIRRQGGVFAAARDGGYLARRAELERTARALFCTRGGKPRRLAPHYLVVEACPWLLTWYRRGVFVRVPLCQVDPDAVSFTYGDLFPTFAPRVQDGKEYRSRVYRLEELGDLIARFGLPQLWNGDGRWGPERYIEAQLWQDEPLGEWVKGIL